MFLAKSNGLLRDFRAVVPSESDAAESTWDRSVGDKAQLAVALHKNASATLRLNLFLKRVFDIVVSSIAIFMLSPLLLLVMALVRLESKGSPVFVQERWGKGGSKIRVYKFRSMYIDQCDVSGVTQTKKNDARITKIGAILRKSNIDELPQLFNVLKGDMSLVGPRCHAIGTLANGVPYEKFVSYYQVRHLMRPGITGLAQVKGFRGPTVTYEQSFGRIQHDIDYLLKFNVLMDIKLMFETVINEIRNRQGF